MAKRVLIVEDEFNIADLIRVYLEGDGFEPIWVQSGEAALDEVARQGFDLVILDIGLPGIDGFEVCRRLRARTAIPILMLTAREDEIDRVAGLESGADDYVVKPFSPRELVARVKAILRRAGSANGSLGDSVLRAGEIELRRDAREVTLSGVPVEVTNREFDLLAALLDHPNVALARDRLLELVWGGEYPGGTRTVDVHVAQLRRKLGDASPIKTVHGVGYKIAAPAPATEHAS
jgi:DNA-binding response OmpR family regulator